MSEPSVEEVARLARHEVSLVQDPVVRDAIAAHLILPARHLRNWDYGSEGDQFPCWTVIEDHVSKTAIVYSRHGHGPGSPWGLVWLTDSWFGMDSGWFLHLEDAFVESHLGSDLPIWDLVGIDGEVVASSMTSDQAFALQKELQGDSPKPAHHVRYRSGFPGGVR